MICISNYASDDGDYPDETLAEIVFGDTPVTLDIENALRAVALVAEHNTAHATIEYVAYDKWRGYKLVLTGGGSLDYERRNKAFWAELAVLANAMGPGRDVRMSNVRTFGKMVG